MAQPDSSWLCILVFLPYTSHQPQTDIEHIEAHPGFCSVPHEFLRTKSFSQFNVERVQSQQADGQIYTENTPAHQLQCTWDWPREDQAVFRLCSRPNQDKDSHHSAWSQKRRQTSRTKTNQDTWQQTTVKMFCCTFESWFLQAKVRMTVFQMTRFCWQPTYRSSFTEGP